MPRELRRHAEYACEQLQKMALEITGTMSKFQLTLADRQCRMAELSSRCQTLITILATSLYAARQSNDVLQGAADVFCQKEIARLTGQRRDQRLLPAGYAAWRGDRRRRLPGLGRYSTRRDHDAVRSVRGG